MSNVQNPPYVELSWSPTSLTTAFAAYRVYRRPSRAPVAPWVLVAELDVPATGLTATQVEAQHTKWRDYQVGWFQDAGGQWADGYDYAVTVKKTNGLESLYGAIQARQIVPAAGNPWVVCNAAPWLNSPVEAVEAVKSASDVGQIVRKYQGRDLNVVRTPRELPGRAVSGTGHFFAVATPDQLRYLRAAEASGRQVSLCRTRGDIITGALAVPSFQDDPGVMQGVALGLTETDRVAALADYNLPPGLVLNGTSQYVSTPDNALLRPGAGPFSVVVAFAKTPWVQDQYLLAKTDYYVWLSAPANSLAFTAAGSDLIVTSAAWFDGQPHVAVATSSGNGAGGTRKLYRDGTLGNSITGAYTAITNTDPVIAGAFGSPVSNYAALSPLHAWAYYGRELTAAEALAASNYLRGIPGSRMPSGAALFFDLRDDRCNTLTGQLTGLAGNGFVGTLVGSPTPRGYPRPMKLLEKF